METEGEHVVKAEDVSQTTPSQSQTVSPTSEGITDGESPWSELAGKFDEKFATLSKELKAAKEEAKQGDQRVKDKRIAKLEKDIEQLKAGYVSLVDRESSVPASRGNEEQESALSAVQDVFVVAGFEKDKVLNSPEFIEYVKVSNGKFDTLGALNYLKALKAKPKVEVSPAAIAQSPGGGAREPDANDLVNNYSNEMIAARGKPAELRAIKARYKKQGVDVDNVGFNA